MTERGVSRRHALAETFSTLSGNPKFRLSADDAAGAVRVQASYLEFVELTTEEILQGLDKAQRLGVREGRVHDYLHALAAKKSGAEELLTVDQNDFNGLVPALKISQV